MNVYVQTVFVWAFISHTTCHAFDWSESGLTKMISIRLIKKDWQPDGPTIERNGTLDEYPWNEDIAFKILLKSSYEYISQPLGQVEQIFHDQQYDSSKDSIVIIHPIFSTADVFFVKTTITALAMRRVHTAYNVFAVDMPYLNPQMIYTVFQYAVGLPAPFEPIANVVANFMVKGINLGLMTPGQVHMVGWSYSGHLIGYIARHIHRIYDHKIGSILVLDPYTNRFNTHVFHVSHEDAQIVHTYHSGSAVAGTRERIGSADFIFNNGILQPECTGTRVLKNTVPEPLICSHLKVVQRFWYVILYPSKFVARKCDSWNRFTSCLCESNPTAEMGFPIEKNREAVGTYYLRTIETKPYGVGVWGAECSSEARMQFRNEQGKAKMKASQNGP